MEVLEHNYFTRGDSLLRKIALAMIYSNDVDGSGLWKQ